MVKIIQDLWIQRKDGIVIFSRVFHQKMETQLFGALMSALETFAKELSEGGGINNFEVANIRFSLIKKQNLLFIVNSAKTVKEKKIVTELEEIADKFVRLFPETTSSEWCEDVNKYACFEKEIEGALEDPVKKFWSDF